MPSSFIRTIGIRTRRQFRLTLRGLAIIIAVGSGYAIGVLTELHLFWWSSIPFLLLLTATIVEFVLADYLVEQSYPIETEKILALLEQRLGGSVVRTITGKLERIIKSFQACDISRISGTVHVTVELGSTPEDKTRYGLLQLTDYVGPDGREKGRITILEKGIIGRCARTGQTQFVNFLDLSEYRRRMIEEFGFSSREAERHTTTARSFIAEPLKAETKVIGVLYFFSTEPQVFPHAARNSIIYSQAEDLVDLLKTVSII